ncbi:hypothetical protein ACP70R_017626 [Stipagrostis hirtigluma subsp. patula]
MATENSAPSTYFSMRLECRYSPRSAYHVIAALSDEQKNAVRSMGFGAMLNYPYIPKVDRQFHLWLLTRFDTDRMVLSISDDLEIPVGRSDIHRVLGIPNGKMRVNILHSSSRTNPTKEMKSILAVGDTENLPTIIEYEQIIEQTRRCSSTEETKKFLCCFLCAMVGNILAPKGRRERIPADLYPALVRPMQAKEYDWCSYVLDELRESAEIVKDLLMSGSNAATIHGCVVALQIIYMDSLPIRDNLSSDNVLPRISAYKSDVFYDIIKKDLSENRLEMYKKFLQHMSAEGPYRHIESKISKRRYRKRSRGKKPQSTDVVISGPEHPGSSTNAVSGAALSLDDITPPHISILKCWENINESIMGTLDKKSESSESSQDHQEQVEQIEGTNLASSTHEDELMLDNKEKQNGSSGRPVCLHGFPDIQDHGNLVSGGLYLVKCAGNYLPYGSDYTILWYPATEPILNIGRLQLNGNSLASFSLSVPRDDKATLSLSKWILSNPIHRDYHRDWVVHKQHRVIAFSGTKFRNQLYGNIGMDNDLCELAFRLFRYNELCLANDKLSAVERHFLSPDWAELVMHGIQETEFDEFGWMFDSNEMKYNVSGCRMVVTLVKLHGSWACYVWDLISKCLTVLDPMVTIRTHRQFGPKHFAEAPRLHGALMRCLEEYCNFDSSSVTQWTLRMFTRLTDEIVINDSGIYSLYAAVNYDGVGLSATATKERLMDDD